MFGVCMFLSVCVETTWRICPLTNPYEAAAWCLLCDEPVTGGESRVDINSPFDTYLSALMESHRNPWLTKAFHLIDEDPI